LSGKGSILNRTFIASVATLMAAISAAEARQSTLSMTCAETVALVQSQGGIVLSTGEFTYDRYVADRRSCLVGEVARASYVPTSDLPRCRLNTCRQIIRTPQGGRD
jgi:hypothetical protein